MIIGLKSWLKELADKQIPILRQSRDQALEILYDDERSSSECSNIILSDPGMMANLFKVMNQQRKKAGRLPITAVSSLISLYGITKLIKEIEAMTCIEELSLPDRNLKGVQSCLKQNWYCTQFALKWVMDRDVREPEEVHVAAVLQSLPELMLWCYGGDILPVIEHRAYYLCGDYYYEVEKALGCHKREIGFSLVQKYYLPEIAGFGFESKYNAYTHGTAVALAALLARLCQHGWYGTDMNFFLGKAAHYFGERDNAASSRIRQQVLDLADVEFELDYRPIASMLLYTDIEKHSEAEYYLASEDQGEVTETKEAPDETLATENISSINKALFAKDLNQLKTLVKEKGNLSDLVKLVLLSLHSTLRFSRVSFLALSADKTKLQAKVNIVGSGLDESTKKLLIDLKSPSLFSAAMKKPQAFTLNKTNREKHWSNIPGNIKSLIYVDSFCIASIYSGKTAIGMVYADMMDEDVSAEFSKAFQTITMMLNKALELRAKA